MTLNLPHATRNWHLHTPNPPEVDPDRTPPPDGDPDAPPVPEREPGQTPPPAGDPPPDKRPTRRRVYMASGPRACG
ncbi:hypothetical protein [Paraburkholderia rhizosphaerae]|uniref:Uncharacterized protein n=1 Tax=Paraburkholderia rhizosphaerae TaxID=480658 RepID=A0A4R8L8D2_9BURK|nr:hypothetical protein [Paraburkholderia rhizosphaerae]TDY39032.1 hypothetical protein BX592_12836 [Paraburkholderia rhizosphaerae]